MEIFSTFGFYILKSKSLIIVLFSTFVALFCLFGCQPEQKKTEISAQEGSIEFETKAIDSRHPLAGLAPSSVLLKYKKNKFVIEMSTMGLFNTSIIGDLKAKEIAQTVKFMNIKQACIETEADIKKENDEYKLNIVETTDTKMIAGFKCYRLKVNRVDSPNVVFDAYYTKDLDLPLNCNELTPYGSVKGVLLDYRLKKLGLEMHFLAKSVKHEAIPDNAFDIPAYMKIVSKEEMQKFFSDL